MKWQLHIYGEAIPAVEALCDKYGIKLHLFEWNEAAKNAGLRKNAVYIIRPDGYVGMAEPDGDVTKITGYLNKWVIGKG